MAHPNIFERQAKVKQLLDENLLTHAVIKKSLSVEFNCSKSAIHADIIHFRTLGTTETIFQSAKTRADIFKRDNGECQYCGNKVAYSYIVEHIIPAYFSGVAKPYNLVWACQKCNAAKRRQVWIPRNFEEITKHHPEWKNKVLVLATKDFRMQNTNEEADSPQPEQQLNH